MRRYHTLADLRIRRRRQRLMRKYWAWIETSDDDYWQKYNFRSHLPWGGCGRCGLCRWASEWKRLEKKRKRVLGKMEVREW